MSSIPYASSAPPTASVPLGPIPARRTGPSIGSTLATGWALALVLSLYGADEIALALRTSAWAGEDPRVLAFADAISTAGRATRLSALHDALEGSPAITVAVAPPPSASPTPSPNPPTPAAPTTPPPATATRPIARILLVGASSIQFHLGVELERVLATGYRDLTVQRLGKLSTGLTRPDVFDWPAKLRELCASFHPDLVIANFGGNDAQSMVLPGGAIARFGQPAWEQTYGARLRDIVGIGRQAGAKVVLLGMSTTRDPVLSRRMGRVNELTDEAARAAGADYLSIWDLGADARGQYQEVSTVGGRRIKTRLADGKHFSRTGAAHVSVEIARRLAALHGLVPAAGDPPTPAPPERPSGEDRSAGLRHGKVP